MLDLKHFFETLSSWAMYALFALLPIFFVPLPWVTLPQAKTLLVIMLFSVAIISKIISVLMDGGGVRIPRTSILLVALLLPIAYGISIFSAGISTYSIWGSGVEQDTLTAVCLWYLVLVGVAVMFSDMLLKSIYAIRALFVGGIVLYLFEFAHLLLPTFTSFGGIFASQTANTFGGWYELGIFSGLLLFLSLACLKTPVARWGWRLVTLGVSILSLLLLIIINSRDVWIVLAAMSGVYIALDLFAGRHWYNILRPKTWYPYLVWMGLIIISLVFIFSSSVITARLPATMQVSVTEVRPSWSGTFQIGSRTLSQPSRLAFGAGPNSFVREWSLYKPAEVNQTAFWNTDFISGVGSIPTSLITTGFFGGFAWLLLIISILWLGLRLAHSRPHPQINSTGVDDAQRALTKNNEEVIFGRAPGPRQGASMFIEPLFLGVLYLIAFHVFYVPGPALSIFAFLLLGLAIGYAASLGRIPHVFLIKKGGAFASGSYLVGLAIFMFAALITSASIAHVVVAEILINRSVVTLNTTGDLALSSRYVSQALRIYPQDTRGQRAAVELGLLQIQKIAAEAPTDQTTAQLKKIIEDTIQYGLKAVSLNGDDYQNWLELAMLYQELAGANVGGAYENAKDAYAKLIADNPTSPLVYLKRAQLELLQKNTDAAIADLVMAVKLKPDFAAAYYLASQIYASNGDFASALPPALSAAQVASGDPLAWYNLGAIAYAGGDFTNAALALERALDLQPQYANALYTLGLSYYQLGRVDDAKRIFAQLNKLDPDQQVVREIINNLNAGKPPFPEATVAAPEASDGKN